MLVSVNDGTVDIADQMTGERTVLLDAIARAFQKLRLCGRGGERT